MAYTPKLSDIPDNTKGYTPTLDDIPKSNAKGIPTSVLHSMASWPKNAFLGAADALQNTFSDAANLVPGVNIPQAHRSSGIAYKAGNIAGNLGAFAGGGEALEGARALGEGIPLAGKALKALGGGGLSGVTRRALGTAGYGALTNPQDRIKGAVEGAVASPVADAVGMVPKGFAKATQFMRPGELTQNILQKLGGGRSIQNNAQSLASDIRQMYQKKTKHG